MKNCLKTLLENDVVPIVNENDTISITELMFTDNDELSGLIATMEDSEALIILSNIDGVYDNDPGTEGAKLIPEIADNGFDPDNFISSETSGFGRGGMITKYRIARKVAKEGVGVHIANGTRDNILIDLMDKSRSVEHTFFIPEEKPTSGVKRWIAYSDSFAKAKLFINDGALKALTSKKAASLLPVGVTKIEGAFKKGDLVNIYTIRDEFVGVGKAQFSAEKLEQEKLATKQMPVIHYDYLYLEELKITSE
jgi:glutamate 5-kinase